MSINTTLEGDLATSPNHRESRACPLCGSARHVFLFNVGFDALLQSNWSYQLDGSIEVPPTVLQDWPIVRCADCGFCYGLRLPGREVLHFVYERLIRQESARRASQSNASLAARMNFLSTFVLMLPDQANVLDFGCGYGPTLALLETFDNITAFGYEPSESRTEILLSSRLPILRSERELDEAGPFHGIVIDNVLEHLPEPLTTLKQIRARCAPNALLFVSVPDANRDYIEAQHSRIRANAIIDMALNPWEHLNYFDLRSLDALLARAGFAAITQCQLCEEVRVGLRPDERFSVRLRNSLATIRRCIKYAIGGDAALSPTRRFYRLESK